MDGVWVRLPLARSWRAYAEPASRRYLFDKHADLMPQVKSVKAPSIEPHLP